MRTHAHPETHGHMHTCVKTHPGRGLRRDAEERSRSCHTHLGLQPRAQGPEPFPSWGMSSTPREQHDQQLPPPQPTRPPAFTGPGWGRNSPGDAHPVEEGRGSRPTHPPAQGNPSCHVHKKGRFHSTVKISVRHGGAKSRRRPSLPFSESSLTPVGPGHHSPGLGDAAGMRVGQPAGWGLSTQESRCFRAGVEVVGWGVNLQTARPRTPCRVPSNGALEGGGI